MNMRDPYMVLGISSDATDEDVKTAYRSLAKKYHPDHYDNNPLSDLAQEKMQEINEAYDSIVRMRQSKSSGYSYGTQNDGYSYTGNSNYFDIRNMIRANRILDAETLLDGVPSEARDAEWNFLKGSVLYRKGWLDDAWRYFSTAVSMDPSNPEYRSALNQAKMHRGPGGYRAGGAPQTGGCTGCDICAGLMCADCCCRCMC